MDVHQADAMFDEDGAGRAIMTYFLCFFMVVFAMGSWKNVVDLLHIVEGLSTKSWMSVIFVVYIGSNWKKWWGEILYSLWDQSEIPWNINFKEGNYKFIEKMEQAKFELAALIGVKFLMFFLCWQWNRGNKTLHYLSNNVFCGNLHGFYSWFQLFMSPVLVTTYIPLCGTFYDCFYLERCGHTAYEVFDIYTIMINPFRDTPYKNWFNKLLALQFISGAFESMTHELSIFDISVYSETSIPGETYWPGLIRAIGGIYLFWELGPENLIKIWKNSTYQMNHYLIVRSTLAIGAFIIGLQNTTYLGYYSRFYGPPTLEHQLHEAPMHQA